MKRTCYTTLCLLFLLIACKLPTESEPGGNEPQQVQITLGVPQVADEGNSTYRVVITGDDMDTIGPMAYSTSKAVTVSVPPGSDRRIFCGKYDANGELLDSGSVTVDIMEGMGQVAVVLVALPKPPQSESPVISAQPVNRIVIPGAAVSFSVVSTGQNLTYQWQKETADIPGAITATYTIPVTTIDDDATTYRCIVTNPAGSDTSTAAVLLVKSNFWKDTIPPVVTLLGGDTVRIEAGDPDERVWFYSNQFQVTDNSGSPITKIDVSSDVNIFVVNQIEAPYTIRYQFADSSGNIGKATRYVHIYKVAVKDTKPPIIIMADPILYIEIGTAFVDPGVSVFDENDGAIPSSDVIVNGVVNTDVVGEYTLTYTVTDAAGNKATATRKVIVRTVGPDRANPVITLIGADTVEVPADVTMPDFIGSYADPGVKAIDAVDGDVTAMVRVSGFIQLNPKIWYITYDVTDAAGNAAATVKRFFETVHGVLVSPPLIDLNYPDSIIMLILPATGPAKWKEPGYTASDVVDGDLTSKVIVDSSNLVANLGKIGSYFVTYSVTNSSNLKVVKMRSVQVLDNPYDIRPPTITLMGRNPDTVLVGSVDVYVEPGFTAVDMKDGDITATAISSGTVNVNALGKYTITYVASDRAGNRGIATRVVWVVRDTGSSDSLRSYVVPSPTSLPSLINKTYAIVEVEGDGPDVSGIRKLAINWDAETKTISSFQIQLAAAPYNVDFLRSSQTFASTGPTLTISNSYVPGLDGAYYVTLQGAEFIWVETTGKYAIIWRE